MGPHQNVSESDVAELLAYIARIRDRTTNTIEEWNLMLMAEKSLEQIPPPDHNGGKRC
jgi:hypothetical protein